MRVLFSARAVVVGTVALGGGALALAAFKGPLAAPTTLALFAAAVVLAELFQVSSDETSLDPGDAHRFSFSSGVHLAAILVLGPWAAALVAAFGVVAVDSVRAEPARKICFNASVFALATAAGGLAFQLAGGVPGDVRLPGDFLAVITLALTYAAVNTVLVTSIVSLSSATRFRSALEHTLVAVVPSTGAEAGLGLLVAVCAAEQPWAIAAIVPLVVAAYQAHARFAMLRRETARALETFANVVDERDPYTFQHSARVGGYVRELAERLGLPSSAVVRLQWAGRLHDLGKIGVDAAVLRKRGALNDDEWAAIRRHPRLSARLLQRFRAVGGEARAVEYHHERFDGNGYYGIDSHHVPLSAHFLMVADTYDALRSGRPYRRGLTQEEALAEIEANIGTQFHPAVAKAFVAVQRGLDPDSALSNHERTEIRRLSLLGRRRGRSLGRALEAHPELVPVMVLGVGLLAFGLGEAAVGETTVVVAAGAAAWRRAAELRARRLAASLASVLELSAPLPVVFNELASRLAYASQLRWAGLLRWRERELQGSVELEWGSQREAPSEVALTSWLIRESETPGELLVGSEQDLGRNARHAALQLSRDGSVAGHLVLAFARPLPRHVELALRSVGEPLAARLASEPGPGTAAPRALAAVS